MVSKTEIEGQKLFGQLLGQKYDAGGAFGYITGGMGSGKTSAMFSLLDYTRKHYPNQKIFLSETFDAPLQCFKLGVDNCRFLVKEDSNVIFRDRLTHLSKVEFLPITYFTDFDDLWKKSRYDRVNVVFFGNRIEWNKFIAYLRHVGEWVHIFIDEIGEIVPAGTSGDDWKAIGQFANLAIHFRKCMMKVIANTQSVRDLDYRVKDKFMYVIFLPGALEDKKHSRVVQSAIDNLDGNENDGNTAYISGSCNSLLSCSGAG